MKERPILFSMVSAILEGWKTQTRRVMAPQPPADPHNVPHARWGLHDGTFWFCGHRCPYGQPGDRLWVRETWAYNGQTSRNYGPKDQRREGYVTYAADGAKVTHMFPDGPMLLSPPQDTPIQREGEDEISFEDRKDAYYKNYFRRMRPSIHMPRWASRLTLEVTEVRAERLQEISEEDAKAEGMFSTHSDLDRTFYTDTAARVTVVDAFRVLWDSINGERPGCSWEANPWVWAISFRRVS